MFFVRFKDGSMISEVEVKNWKNVPKDKPIKQIGLFIPLYKGNVMELCPLPPYCEKYYCTKLGRQIIGRDRGRHIGYALGGIKNGVYYRVEITAKRAGPLQIFSVGIAEATMNKEVWRDGC